MKTIANALIQSAAFLELCGEDVVSLDDSVRAMEEIGHILKSASPEELAVLRQSLDEMAAEERAGRGRRDVLMFYEQFFDGFGLVE